MAVYNPLHDLNTYSYHHFLVVANSSSVLTSLEDAATFFQFASGNIDVPGAVMLINPIKSVRFVIDEIEWTSHIAAIDPTQDAAVSTGGIMKIIEPQSALFMSEVYRIFRQLGCTFETGQLMLKTVFMGESKVGTFGERASMQYINNITPLRLNIAQVEMAFQFTGGEYKFHFVAASDGGGLAPNINARAAMTNASINLNPRQTESGVTLGQGLRTLQDKLNSIYNAAYEQHVRDRAQAGVDPTDRRTIRFIIPSEFDRPDFILRVVGRQSGDVRGFVPILSVNPGRSISELISDVIALCPEYQAQAVSPGGQFTHKIIASTIQHPPGSEFRQEVVYTIMKQPIVVTDRNIDESSYVLEYDYLYTGKNVDVLEFDMKMAASGTSFFAAVTSTPIIRSDRSQVQKNDHQVAFEAHGDTSSPGRTDVFTGAAPSTPTQASSYDPATRAAYDQMMQQWAALDVAAVVKIKGNPLLLSDTTATLDTTGSITATANLIELNSSSVPIKARINVKMPSYEDPSILEPFWYNGLYNVFSIRNRFSGGDFTQQLMLCADLKATLPPMPDEPRPAPSAEPAVVAIDGEPGTEAARVRAFLQVIRRCEGTTGDKGYSTLFNYNTFDSFADHPRIVITAGSYSSSAAGAYQILTKTWDTVIQANPRYKSRCPDFSPVSQDNAGWCLLDGRKALPLIRQNKIEEAILKCNTEWASLPASPHGQPTRTMSEVIKWYNEFYQAELEGITTLAAPMDALT